jgi:hypothetical protein
MNTRVSRLLLALFTAVNASALTALSACTGSDDVAAKRAGALKSMLRPTLSRPTLTAFVHQAPATQTSSSRILQLWLVGGEEYVDVEQDRRRWLITVRREADGDSAMLPLENVGDLPRRQHWSELAPRSMFVQPVALSCDRGSKKTATAGSDADGRCPLDTLLSRPGWFVVRVVYLAPARRLDLSDTSWIGIPPAAMSGGAAISPVCPNALPRQREFGNLDLVGCSLIDSVRFEVRRGAN